MPQFAAGCEGILAVGGKTPRRSYDRAEQRSPLHLVSARAEEQCPALEQVTVDSKSNEVMALAQAAGDAHLAEAKWLPSMPGAAGVRRPSK